MAEPLRVLRWAAPPPRSYAATKLRGRDADVLLDLHRHPGEWGVVLADATKDAAQTVAIRLRAARTPGGCLEVAQRRVGDGYQVHARYVPDKARGAVGVLDERMWSAAEVALAVDALLDDGDPEMVEQLLDLLGVYRPAPAGRRGAGGAR